MRDLLSEVEIKMSIQEYYQNLGVVHDENCKVCSGLDIHTGPTSRISFWLVIDIGLIISLAVMSYILVILIINSITP